MKTTYLGGGCFWGMEELFRKEKGVLDTETGYCGGGNENPTYSNHEGHAETLKIVYDENETDFKHLLDFFFRIHNPTTLNQQGNDIGTSYRSVIFYQNEEEKRDAEEFIKLVDESGVWKDPAVTTLEPFQTFWSAEDEHQDYLQTYPEGYTCHAVKFDSFLK
jgi:peptide-methionine (S)-S-oxide reductase